MSEATARSGTSGNERRTEPRYRVDVSVAWTDGRRARSGAMLDVSAHGVFLHPAWTPTEAVRQGDVIELFCRVGEQAFEIRGEVCWIGHSDRHEDDGIGLRVVDEKRLEAMLAALGAA